MAVNQEIKIVFTVDDSQLEDAKKSTVDLGNAVEADKKKYKELADIIEQELSSELKKAGVVAGQFSKEMQDGSAKATSSVKSLRTELKEAKQAAVEAAAKFGESSKEFATAAKRAGDLKAQLGDLNDTLDALDPDAKAKAFTQVGQAAFGAFQVATGALQAFGVESEKVNKLAQQFQGFINITQGLSQLGQLSDALKNVGTVLGVTSSAQKALAASSTATAVALEGEAVAANTAAVSTRGFTAALVANPITAILVALTALVGGIYLYNSSTEESTELTDEQTYAFEEQRKKLEELAEAYANQNAVVQQGITDARLRLALAKGLITDVTFQLQKLEQERQKAVSDFVAKYGNDIIGIAEINKKFGLEEQIIRAKEAADFKKAEEQKTQKLKEEAAKRNQTRKKEPEVILAPKLGGLTTDPAELKAAYDKVLNGIEVKGRETYSDLIVISENWATRNAKIIELSFQLYAELSGTITDITRQNTEERIDAINTQFDAEREAYDTLLKDKRISQKEYDDSVAASEKKKEQDIKKLQREQAIREKLLAIFSATLTGALSVLNAAATFPFNPAIVALTATIAAANLAAVIAAPIPKFAKGTLSVGGGQEGTDSVHAMLMPGEAVIPTRVNRKYKEPIKAIFHESVGADELTQFIQMTPNMRYALLMAAGEQFNESIVNKPTNISTAQIMNSYITQAVRGSGVSSRSSRPTSVNVDMSGVERSIRNNKSVRLDNTKQLAQQIASSITDSINIRRKW